VDTQTRHALKQDKLVEATQTSLEWLQEHRERAIQWAIVCVLVIGAAIAGAVTYYHRSAAANLAFGEAMDTYNAPLAQPGQPTAPGELTFPSAAQRAKAAHDQFAPIANRYSWLNAGKTARYFTGITAMELGQNAAAEADLERVADSQNANLAALAKLALAGLYQQTNRSAKAVVLYQQLIAKPTVTVPASAAQLQLAALYQTTNPAQAQRIYAQLKNDKGAAGEIAAQKLAQK
jgi:tetratricopeptide (TPR) repeat protein